MEDKKKFNVYGEDEFTLTLENGKTQHLKIEYDFDPENPRKWDGSLCHMYTWGRDTKTIGDKHNYASTDEFLKEITQKYFGPVDAGKLLYDCYSAQECIKREKALFEAFKDKGVLMKFIYYFEHSGATISTHDFCDPWDSGIIGFVYIDRRELSTNSSITDENWLDLCDKYLETEVTLVRDWLEGNVFGFSITQDKICEHCGHVEEEDIDSCCGFYGNDIYQSGMYEYLPKEWQEFFDKGE